MTEPSPLEPSIALAAYAEPLASNRRVLVFGNALASLPLQLLERGARSVHVCDLDPLRVSEALTRNRSTQISFSNLADRDLALREGAFDLALIDNLGAFDVKTVLGTAKRVLGTRGVAVVACPNPEAAFPLLRTNHALAAGLDYYALYDAVAAEFEYVRMLGQTPFVGYAIADFSASGEPEPALDTSFVPGGAEEPDSFIALASAHEVRLDEFAVIQLPTRRVFGSVAAFSLPSLEVKEQSKARDAEHARLNQWIKELESRASTADERADHAETELEELQPKLEVLQKTQAAEKTQHDKEVSAVRAELSALRTQSSTLRAEASTLRAEASTLRSDHSKLLAETNALRVETKTQAAENARLNAELSRLTAERAQATAELTRLKAQLADREGQLAELRAQVEQAGSAEVEAFERQLLERGEEIRKLEGDLRTAERTGRELVREQERRHREAIESASPELERALAEREADLQAAAWTIESLSLRLELAGKSTEQVALPPESAPPSAEAR